MVQWLRLMLPMRGPGFDPVQETRSPSHTQNRLCCNLSHAATKTQHSTLSPKDIHLGEMGMHVHTRACTGMFIAALFKIALRWKPPKCPSLDERINQMWCSRTSEYSSATKRSETQMHAAIKWTVKTVCKWRKSITEDHVLYDSLVGNVQNRQIYRRNERELMVFLGEGWEMRGNC